jgi:hypothetical protein
MALLRGTSLQLITTPPVDDVSGVVREAVRTVRTAYRS